MCDLPEKFDKLAEDCKGGAALARREVVWELMEACRHWAYGDAGWTPRV